MKKNKIILLNLLIFLFIFCIFDYLYYKVMFYDYIKRTNNIGMKTDNHYRYKTFEIFNPEDQSSTYIYKYFLEKKLYPKPILPDIKNSDSLHSPILLFGDSYTWLISDVGLQKQLSYYTNKAVYNFSFWCWGTTHFYYLTHNPNLYKIIEENKDVPTLAMYTYIRDHRMRINSVKDYFVDVHPYLTYKYQNGQLIMQNNNFFSKILYRFFTFRYIKDKFQKESDEYAFELLYQLISQSYFELKKHYPNIKFVFFYYYQGEPDNPDEDIMIEKLKKLGIIYINTKDLTKENLSDKKYTMEDGSHPNKAAWDIICKPLSAKLNKIINTPS